MASAAMTPIAKTSARWSTSAPISCSGAMYPAVPITTPGPREAVGLVACRAHLREAEVEHLDDVATGRGRGDQHVLRFEIAMDHLMLVRGGDTFADLLEPDRGDCRRQMAAVIELASQRPSPHELHHQERTVGANRSEIEDRDDVRMRQPRTRLCLAFEASQRLAITERRGRGMILTATLRASRRSAAS